MAALHAFLILVPFSLLLDWWRIHRHPLSRTQSIRVLRWLLLEAHGAGGDASRLGEIGEGGADGGFLGGLAASWRRRRKRWGWGRYGFTLATSLIGAEA